MHAWVDEMGIYIALAMVFECVIYSQNVLAYILPSQFGFFKGTGLKIVELPWCLLLLRP